MMMAAPLEDDLVLPLILLVRSPALEVRCRAISLGRDGCALGMTSVKAGGVISCDGAGGMTFFSKSQGSLGSW
jgi:hypothetical protein